MTIGIGGWGSRRKPMALVRAILRSGLKDLEIVSYGGPDVGLLVAGGHVRRVVCGFVSLDTIPLEPHFRLGRQQGAVELTELDEGMLHWGLLAAAHRLPFLPIRAGLGSDVLRVNPELRTVRSPYADGEELVAMPALRLDAALIHLNRADAAGNGQYLGPDPYFDDLFCLAAERAFMSCERIVPTAGLLESGPPQSLLVNRAMVHGVVETPGRRALHQLRAGLRPRRGVPGPLRRGGRRPGGVAAVPCRVPGRRRGQLPAGRAAVRRGQAASASRRHRQPHARARAQARHIPERHRRWLWGGRAGLRCAWWRARRRGAATAPSWPARWA